MSLSHLGERATELVDGRLSAAEAERATIHLASCRECRDAVELERLTKQSLSRLADPAREPVPSAAFMLQLVAMGGPGEAVKEQALPAPAADTFVFDAGMAPPMAPVPVAAYDLPVQRQRVRPRPRLVAAMVAAACVVGAGAAVGGVASGSSAARPNVVPPVDTFVAEHGATAATLPFTDQSVVWGAPTNKRR
ncbi:anti-sigma factor family protein [Spongisporangium articulatum]|uniref:Anti-sigma factor family protein n=1 Tax=Spongisporangium articulatum TaxID=3362603 RepID=A0ABW8AQ61_9ACTN